jgi:hypothetical protein
MEPYNEERLIAELRALRPLPRPEFAAELDGRAAAGFPRRRGDADPLPSLLRRAVERTRGPSLWQVLLPAGGVALVGLFAVAALITFGESGGGESGVDLGERSRGGALGTAGAPAGKPPNPAPNSASAGSGATYEAEFQYPNALSSGAGDSAANAVPRHRDVERSATMVLAADPGDVDADSAGVFRAVHEARGIVLRSTTTEGPPGRAGASFDLLIPRIRLNDALDAFSQIDRVRSRHEATADITAPTVGVSELLQDAEARIESLLDQLAGAETEGEREAVEVELRRERRQAAVLRSRLSHLHHRARLSRVSLRIVTGGPAASGDASWGVDDALRDAGGILSAAAAAAVVALAVIGPLALLALLVWLSRRAWIRRERRRALS